MGSFLQTRSAAAIRRLVVDAELSSVDRDVMVSFLAQKQGASYAPQGGQITGILKQMLETMEGDLRGITKEENAAKKAFAELTAAKEKEVAANSKAIEDKTARRGRVGVKIEELREDLEDTSSSYDEDKKFLKDMEKNCATKKDEWDAVKKTRAEEMLALAETIKILNDDDALDLFKKTLPSPSLLQLKLQGRDVRKRALQALGGTRTRGKRDTRLDLIALALHGKKVSFDKVLTMIDEMTKLLHEEQASDDDKKAYCEKELDENEDKHKQLELEISDLTKTIDESKRVQSRWTRTATSPSARPKRTPCATCSRARAPPKPNPPLLGRRIPLDRRRAARNMAATLRPVEHSWCVHLIGTSSAGTAGRCCTRWRPTIRSSRRKRIERRRSASFAR